MGRRKSATIIDGTDTAIVVRTMGTDTAIVVRTMGTDTAIVVRTMGTDTAIVVMVTGSVDGGKPTPVRTIDIRLGATALYECIERRVPGLTIR